MSEWHRFTDTAGLDSALADHIAAALQKDIAARGSASLAVSGGGTPKQMFRQLATRKLDWSKVWITLVDERWVDPTSPDSNERLLRENLLQGGAASAKFLSLKSLHEDAAEGLDEIGQRVAILPKPFSVIILGMGGDGHTASWFPQAENLAALLDPAGKAEVASTDPVTAAHQRVTLTLPAVLNSRELVLHITGEDKRRILQDACEQAYPVATLLQQNTTPLSIWWAPS